MGEEKAAELAGPFGAGRQVAGAKSPSPSRLPTGSRLHFCSRPAANAICGRHSFFCLHRRRPPIQLAANANVVNSKASTGAGRCRGQMPGNGEMDAAKKVHNASAVGANDAPISRWLPVTAGGQRHVFAAEWESMGQLWGLTVAAVYGEQEWPGAAIEKQVNQTANEEREYLMGNGNAIATGTMWD